MDISETPSTSGDMTNSQSRPLVEVSREETEAKELNDLQEQLNEFKTLKKLIFVETMKTENFEAQSLNLRAELKHPDITEEHFSYIIESSNKLEEEIAVSGEKQKVADCKIDRLLGKDLNKHRIPMNKHEIQNILLKLKSPGLKMGDRVTLGEKLFELRKEGKFLQKLEEEEKLTTYYKVGFTTNEDRTRWANVTAMKIKSILNKKK